MIQLVGRRHKGGNCLRLFALQGFNQFPRRLVAGMDAEGFFAIIESLIVLLHIVVGLGAAKKALRAARVALQRLAEVLESPFVFF